MSIIEIPRDAETLENLSAESQTTVRRLDKIFWNEILKMKLGKMLKEINPVGGYEKANAVREIAKKVNVDLSDIIYLGDSITDVAPLKLVRNGGGLTVSFNGNRYAIKEAEIAVMSHHTIVTSILADLFNKFSKAYLIRLAENWSPSALKGLCNPILLDRLKTLYPNKAPRVEKITSNNIEWVIQESSAFRKIVRGEAIGRLG